MKPDGFGLVKPDSVKFTDTGIAYISPKSQIRDVSPGKSLIGFLRGDGNASVIRLNTRDHVKCGKLSMYFMYFYFGFLVIHRILLDMFWFCDCFLFLLEYRYIWTVL